MPYKNSKTGKTYANSTDIPVEEVKFIEKYTPTACNHVPAPKMEPWKKVIAYKNKINGNVIYPNNNDHSKVLFEKAFEINVINIVEAISANGLVYCYDNDYAQGTVAGFVVSGNDVEPLFSKRLTCCTPAPVEISREDLDAMKSILNKYK